jgi:hypothetical protein
VICPVCKTNHSKDQQAEFCVQCGTDIHVHRLLKKVGEEMQMNNTALSEKRPTKMSIFSQCMQLIPPFLLVAGTGFGIFVGMRFLSFIEQAESQRTSLSTKWSETGFEQLQQMNATIKQALDLIIDQRKENVALQSKVNELSAVQTAQSHAMETVIPPIGQG